MAITFTPGSNIPINASDRDGGTITYSVVEQPGDNYTGFSNNTDIQLIAGGYDGTQAKYAGIRILTSGSAAAVTIDKISLVKVGEEGTELFPDADCNDLTLWTGVVNNVTDNGNGTFNFDPTSANADLLELLTLEPNTTYKMLVRATIPINTTLRFESYHFDDTNRTTNNNAFYGDRPGNGVETEYEFFFYPSITKFVDGTSVVSAALNGGPGSADYGVNNSTSKSYKHPNTLDAEHTLLIRATDDSGELAERQFRIRTHVPWRYIASLSHSYIMGGYIGAESWRTVCQCTNSTDTTVSLGAKLASNGVTSPNSNRSGLRYSDASSDRWTGQAIGYGTYAYDSSNRIECYNMITNTAYNNSASLANSNNYSQSWTDDTRRFGYNGGGSIAIYEKFNLSTMTRVGQLSGYVQQTAHGAWFTETHGYTYTSGNKVNEACAFATDTRTTGAYNLGSTAHGTNGTAHTKGLSTLGFGNNEALLMGWNVVVNTTVVQHTTGTSFAGPNQTTNNGEGNCASGTIDSHGYSLGGFNGGQNNHADRYNYSTRTITRVAAADLKPHAGASSGGAIWAEI